MFLRAFFAQLLRPEPGRAAEPGPRQRRQQQRQQQQQRRQQQSQHRGEAPAGGPVLDPQLPAPHQSGGAQPDAGGRGGGPHRQRAPPPPPPDLRGFPRAAVRWRGPLRGLGGPPSPSASPPPPPPPRPPRPPRRSLLGRAVGQHDSAGAEPAAPRLQQRGGDPPEAEEAHAQEPRLRAVLPLQARAAEAHAGDRKVHPAEPGGTAEAGRGAPGQGEGSIQGEVREAGQPDLQCRRTREHERSVRETS